LQQQNDYVKRFEDAASNGKLSIYEAQRILVESYGPTHVIAAKDEESRDTFYRRLTLAAGLMITRACENERNGSHVSAVRQNAAVVI
jgi:hypothetical protein